MARNIERFKVTVNNWGKHNPAGKKSYTHFLISKSFFNDDKITTLTPNEVTLYLYLLTICAESASNCFIIHAQLIPNSLRIRTQSLRNALSLFQSLQLVTYEEIDAPFNKIRYNKIRKDRIRSSSEVEKEPSSESQATSLANDNASHLPTPLSKNKEHNRLAFESYKNAFYLRYKIEPVRSAKTNAAIAQIVSRVGHEEAPGMLDFFVWHNDPFYLKSMHQIGLALRDCESLRIQYLKGKPITMKDVKNFETANNLASLENDLQKGGF